MSKGLILATLVAVAAISIFVVEQNNKVDAFEQWKQDFGTEFLLGEESYRRFIFEANLREIERHNADSTQTYKKGINQFTIYTQEEFSQRYLSNMVIPQTEDVEIVQFETTADPSNDVDWTTKGGVSKIKNQGQCGSCWAFSATGVTESWSLVSKKASADLSEQQLVDCSRSYGNQGCNGGWPSSALKYAAAKGLASESQYPYTARDGSCKLEGGSFKIGTVKASAQGNCNDMMSAINTAPLSVTVDANNWSSYHSGVLSTCGHSVDHAVLLVGIVDGAWKIKNSWGTSWGEAGYIRLAAGNTCAVCQYGGVWIA